MSTLRRHNRAHVLSVSEEFEFIVGGFLYLSFLRLPRRYNFFFRRHSPLKMAAGEKLGSLCATRLVE